MNEATREDMLDIARNAAEYRKKLSEPRTTAGRALLADKHWALHAPLRGCVQPCSALAAIARIEAEAALPDASERLAKALHAIEPNLTCIASRNPYMGIDCTKPDISRATAILAALGPVPSAPGQREALAAVAAYLHTMWPVENYPVQRLRDLVDRALAAPVEPGQ